MYSPLVKRQPRPPRQGGLKFFNMNAGQRVWKRSIPWSGGKTVGNDQVESACGVAKDWVTRGFLSATLLHMEASVQSGGYVNSN